MALMNGDPAYLLLADLFKERGLSDADLALAFRAVRAAMRRQIERCLECCDSDGRCNCAPRIRAMLGVADGC